MSSKVYYFQNGKLYDGSGYEICGWISHNGNVCAMIGHCPFHSTLSFTKTKRYYTDAAFISDNVLIQFLRDDDKSVRESRELSKKSFSESKRNSLSTARETLRKKRTGSKSDEYKKKVYKKQRKASIIQEKMGHGPPNLTKRKQNTYQKKRESGGRISHQIFSNPIDKLPPQIQSQVRRNQGRGKSGIVDLGIQCDSFLKTDNLCRVCKIGHYVWIGKSHVRGLYFKNVYACSYQSCPQYKLVDSSSFVQVPPRFSGKSRNLSVPEINLRSVIGATKVGISGEKLKNFLPFTGAGRLGNDTFSRNRGYLNVPVHQLATENFLKWEKIEGLKTLENKSVDQSEAKDGVTDTQHNFDGSWTKRGRQHNSDTGVAVQIGEQTTKITNVRAFSKRCAFCEEREKRNQPIPEEHLKMCRRNFPRGRASGDMEPVGNLLMIQETNQHGNIRVKVMGGDGDSTTEAHARETLDYRLRKKEDQNHLEKCCGKWIRELSAELVAKGDKKLNEVEIQKIQKTIIIVLKKSKDEEEGKFALRNLLNHWWDIHQDCGKIHGGEWCRGRGEKEGFSFRVKNSRNLRTLLDIHVISRLISYIHNIIDLCSTNPCEYFNAKLHRKAPKTDNHGLSSKWHTVVHMTSLEFNEGNYESSLMIMDKMNIDTSRVDLHSMQMNENETKYRKEYMKKEENYRNHLKNKKKRSKTKSKAATLTTASYKGNVCFQPEYIAMSCQGPTFSQNPEKIFPSWDPEKEKNIGDDIIKDFVSSDPDEKRVWGEEVNLKSEEKQFLRDSWVVDSETTGLNKKQQRRATQYNEGRRYRDTHWEVTAQRLAGKPSSSNEPKPHTQMSNPAPLISPLCWSKASVEITKTNPLNPEVRKKMESCPQSAETSKSFVSKISDSSSQRPIVIAKKHMFDRDMIIQERYFPNKEITKQCKDIKWVEAELFLSPVPTELSSGEKVLEKGNMKQENLYSFYCGDMNLSDEQHRSEEDVRQAKELIFVNCGNSLKLVGAVGSQILYQLEDQKSRTCSCSKKGVCKGCRCVKKKKKLKKKLMEELEDEEKVLEKMKIDHPYVGFCGPLCKCRGKCCNQSIGLKKLRIEQEKLRKKKELEYSQNGRTFNDLVVQRQKLISDFRLREGFSKGSNTSSVSQKSIGETNSSVQNLVRIPEEDSKKDNHENSSLLAKRKRNGGNGPVDDPTIGSVQPPRKKLKNIEDQVSVDMDDLRRKFQPTSNSNEEELDVSGIL